MCWAFDLILEKQNSFKDALYREYDELVLQEHWT